MGSGRFIGDRKIIIVARAFSDIIVPKLIYSTPSPSNKTNLDGKLNRFQLRVVFDFFINIIRSRNIYKYEHKKLPVKHGAVYKAVKPIFYFNF